MKFLFHLGLFVLEIFSTTIYGLCLLIGGTQNEMIMQTIIHKADSRGFLETDWLKTAHSFSFGNYHNPDRMQFGALRVLNDDNIDPGMGFGGHPHDNMEIITIPLKGELAHEDNTGETEVLKPGQIQVMSAGSGIWHSEFNSSTDNLLSLLQIWILPSEKDVKPRYQSFSVDQSQMKNRWYKLVGPTNEGDVWIYQDARISITQIEEDISLSYEIKSKDHGVYFFLIEGEAEIAGNQLSKRDGIGVYDFEKLDLPVKAGSEILAIEVPMKV